MVAYYQSDFIEGHSLHMAYQEVPLGVLAGLLDTIRTRVLNMALDIRTEIGGIYRLREIDYLSKSPMPFFQYACRKGPGYLGKHVTRPESPCSTGMYDPIFRHLFRLCVTFQLLIGPRLQRVIFQFMAKHDALTQQNRE